MTPRALARIAALLIVGSILVLAALDWAGQDENAQDARNEASWLTLRRRQQAETDSLKRLAARSASELARARRARDRERQRLDSMVASFRVIDTTTIAAPDDTTRLVLVHRPGIDARAYTVPLFVIAAVEAGVRATDSAYYADALAIRLEEQRIALERGYERILSAQDSVIRTRDRRIRELNKRRWFDYVAAACGVGFRGGDCIIGARVPFGR